MSTFEGYFEAQFGRTIRADRFTNQDPATRIQLLSHVHTDHTVGLSSSTLSGSVYCSPATKDLVLRTATAKERVYADVYGSKSDAYYTFTNLQEPVKDVNGRQVRQKDGKRARKDVLIPLSLDVRHDFSEAYGSPLFITLIDANHCLGAVMFLIESPSTAILYTGDVRSEPFLINNLARNPILSPYVSLHGLPPKLALDEIYLDTSAASVRARTMSKREGVEAALKLFDMFPPDTRFFLNTWTWGWEELLRGVARKYNCMIHLDEYKLRAFRKAAVANHDTAHSSMSSNEYPSIDSIGTSSFSSSRFHACERRWKCPQVRTDNGIGCFQEPEMQKRWEADNKEILADEEALTSKGKRPLVVFVNPCDGTSAGWSLYEPKISKQCQNALAGKGEWPKCILAPLARHSTLPELRDLVRLFQPQTIFPNTLYPDQEGLDYLKLADLFSDCLAAGGRERLLSEATAYRDKKLRKGRRSSKKGPDHLPNLDGMTEELLQQEDALSAKWGISVTRENFEGPIEDDDNDYKLLMQPSPSDLDADSAQGILAARVPGQPIPSGLPVRDPEPILHTTDTSDSSGISVPSLLIGESHVRSRDLRSKVARPSSPGRTPILPAAKGSAPSSLLLASTSTSGDASLPFLAGKVFYFTSAMTAEMERWRPRIEEAGAVIITAGASRTSIETAVKVASMVVCEQKEGWEYELAVDHGKTMGTTAWLVFMFERSMVAEPSSHLLWSPLPPSPISGAERITVSYTGFGEEEKAVLRRLVENIGAQHIKDFVRSETTVLITTDFALPKCSRAQKWKIPVVNVLWLEDCFLRRSILSVETAVYRLSPPQRRLGERRSTDPAARETASPLAQPGTPHATPSRQQPRTPLSATSASKRRAPSLSLSPGMANAQQSKKRKSDDPQAESFKSTSTADQDDTQQIRNISETYTKNRGRALPRLKSVEER